MSILDTAIQAEGGVGKLAHALGVRQNVVSNWRKRRLPRPWQLLLTQKYGESMPLPSPAQLSPARPAISPEPREVAHG